MKPLPTVEGEEEIREILDEHSEDEIKLYTVHAVAGWNSKDEQVFDSWTVLKETEENGEEELRHYDNTGRKDGKSAKEQAKNHARKLARENRPAVVKIENRDFETQRVEVAE